jgi:NTE family protein
MTSFDMQSSLLRRTLGTFWTLLETRADDLSALMQKHWKITAKISDLPATPRWMINATCYETGKNWRFERFRMGDYLFGYSNDTNVPLSDALAASAGFPGLIGGLVFKTGGRKWFRYETDLNPSEHIVDTGGEKQWQKVEITPRYPKVHLWDGGAYDNHGLEGIHDFITGWSKKFGFLIVSDAAGHSGEAEFKPGVQALMRLATGIMMSQVRSLRSRAILERIKNHPEDKGVFLKMGNSCEYILTSGGKGDLLEQYRQGMLSADDVQTAANMPTVIRKLTPSEYECLFHHGYEVADATLSVHYPDDFRHIPYSS